NFMVKVTDIDPPTPGCPGPIAVSTDPGECTASVPFAASPTDNCTVGSIVYSTNGVPITSPNIFPKGPTTVDVKVMDVNGNMSMSSFMVTVTDNEPPSPGCPMTIGVNADPGQCTASVPFAASPTDNCGVMSTVYSTNTVPITSPNVFPTGTTTVDVKVTDVN